MEEVKRAALYVRVSTEEQAEHGLSLADQKTTLEAYAKANNMKIVGMFADEGISARKSYTKRPACCRLLEYVKSGDVDVILFIKLDRWFRNIAGYYKVQEILDKYKVDWIATEERYDTTTANGRLSLNIRLSVAQDRADRASERVKFVFRGKVARGEAIGCNFALGYKREGNCWVIDEEKAEIVRDLFNYYEDNLSIRAVMRYANDIYGISYSPRAVWWMLTNRAYVGEFRGNKGYCPPIISKEQFGRVQKLVESRSVRRSPSGRIYLFSGLMRCPVCGKMLVCQYSHVGKCTYYKCPDAYNKKGCTNRKMIRESRLEQQIIEQISGDMESMRPRTQQAKKAPPKIEREKIVKKLKKLKDLYLNDLISLDDYKVDYAKYNAQLEEADRFIETEVDYSMLARRITEFVAEYKDLDNTEKKRFFNRIIDHIELDDGLNPTVIFR